MMYHYDLSCGHVVMHEECNPAALGHEVHQSLHDCGKRAIALTVCTCQQEKHDDTCKFRSKA
jgi:hypothetical protein